MIDLHIQLWSILQLACLVLKKRKIHERIFANRIIRSITYEGVHSNDCASSHFCEPMQTIISFQYFFSTYYQLLSSNTKSTSILRCNLGRFHSCAHSPCIKRQSLMNPTINLTMMRQIFKKKICFQPIFFLVALAASITGLVAGGGGSGGIPPPPPLPTQPVLSTFPLTGSPACSSCLKPASFSAGNAQGSVAVTYGPTYAHIDGGWYASSPLTIADVFTQQYFQAVFDITGCTDISLSFEGWCMCNNTPFAFQYEDMLWRSSNGCCLCLGGRQHVGSVGPGNIFILLQHVHVRPVTAVLNIPQWSKQCLCSHLRLLCVWLTRLQLWD